MQIILGVHATQADANERGGRRFKEGKSFKPLLPRRTVFTNVSAVQTSPYFPLYILQHKSFHLKYQFKRCRVINFWTLRRLQIILVVWWLFLWWEHLLPEVGFWLTNSFHVKVSHSHQVVKSFQLFLDLPGFVPVT